MLLWYHMFRSRIDHQVEYKNIIDQVLKGSKASNDSNIKDVVTPQDKSSNDKCNTNTTQE
jgi:hypothetical protein